MRAAKRERSPEEFSRRIRVKREVENVARQSSPSPERNRLSDSDGACEREGPDLTLLAGAWLYPPEAPVLRLMARHGKHNVRKWMRGFESPLNVLQALRRLHQWEAAAAAAGPLVETELPEADEISAREERASEALSERLLAADARALFHGDDSTDFFAALTSASMASAAPRAPPMASAATRAPPMASVAERSLADRVFDLGALDRAARALGGTGTAVLTPAASIALNDAMVAYVTAVLAELAASATGKLVGKPLALVTRARMHEALATVERMPALDLFAVLRRCDGGVNEPASRLTVGRPQSLELMRSDAHAAPLPLSAEALNGEVRAATLAARAHQIIPSALVIHRATRE